MNWNEVVGRNVRRRREALGLSQEQLAHDADVAVRHIGAIERGKQNPSLAALAKVASALGCLPADLLTPRSDV